MKMINPELNASDICTAMKEKYYHDLEIQHEQYDVFLHDMKHTLKVIAALSEDGNCEEIKRLIEGLRISLGKIQQQSICSHKILNALLLERKGYADDNGVILEFDIKEPIYLQGIEEIDLITLMGNLLDNAIEAEKCAEKQDGILCCIRMAREKRHVIIEMENSYEEEKERKVIKLNLRERIGEKHGIGLKSVQKIVNKYGGIMESSKEQGRYRVKIILSVQNM